MIARVAATLTGSIEFSKVADIVAFNLKLPSKRRRLQDVGVKRSTRNRKNAPQSPALRLVHLRQPNGRRRPGDELRRAAKPRRSDRGNQGGSTSRACPRSSR